jgi:hypothetical protein
MGSFSIDFFELAFLAEACVPPVPIARHVFWDNLTDRYWEQMSHNERSHLWEWMNRREKYKSGLDNNEDIQIFESRFNPDNQYSIELKTGEIVKAFKYNERYHINIKTSLVEDYIVKIEKH